MREDVFKKLVRQGGRQTCWMHSMFPVNNLSRQTGKGFPKSPRVGPHQPNLALHMGRKVSASIDVPGEQVPLESWKDWSPKVSRAGPEYSQASIQVPFAEFNFLGGVGVLASEGRPANDHQYHEKNRYPSSHDFFPHVRMRERKSRT